MYILQKGIQTTLYYNIIIIRLNIITIQQKHSNEHKKMETQKKKKRKKKKNKNLPLLSITIKKCNNYINKSLVSMVTQ